MKRFEDDAQQTRLIAHESRALRAPDAVASRACCGLHQRSPDDDGIQTKVPIQQLTLALETHAELRCHSFPQKCDFSAVIDEKPRENCQSDI